MPILGTDSRHNLYQNDESLQLMTRISVGDIPLSAQRAVLVQLLPARPKNAAVVVPFPVAPAVRLGNVGIKT